MSLSLILARVQADVASIIGATRVHVGKRAWQTAEELLAAAQDTGATIPRAHLCYVRWRSSPEAYLDSAANLVEHAVWLEWFYQAHDPTADPAAVTVGTTMTSEAAFAVLIEQVAAVLRNDAHLHGGDVASKCSPPQVTQDPNLRPLDPRCPEIPCHYAEIHLTIGECVSRSLVA